MAGRRRRDELTVSLFPFLSVLACVIGVLTLLLAALALGSVSGPSMRDVELADRFQALKLTLEADRVKLEELKKQLSTVEEESRVKESLEQRLAGLGLMTDVSLAELEATADLLERESELAEREEKLIREAKRLDASSREKKQQIDERESLRAAAPIRIDPSGVGRRYEPWLIECTAEHLRVLSVKSDWSFRIPKEEILGEGQFKRYLRRLSAVRLALAIFLIRPDGVETYQLAEAAADRQKLRHAKLPLPGYGELDLSLFPERASLELGDAEVTR